jgi:uracil-DNA glycosylase family 4
MILKRLEKEIVSCRKCRRLVLWREKIAHDKVKRFAGCEYWGKPCPGFGDPDARVLLIGLAPAAHGGNRTGRMFTGDRSGDWLFRTLYKTGFANRPDSVSRDDGMLLRDCFITATCRCAPPKNTLLRSEVRNCRPYLVEELRQLKKIKVIIGLGKVGFDAATECLSELGLARFAARPKFGHSVEYRVNGRLTLLGSFHPSQQNTFTGRLTQPMFDSVFRRAKRILGRR